jgi:hypothetical protein
LLEKVLVVIIDLELGSRQTVLLGRHCTLHRAGLGRGAEHTMSRSNGKDPVTMKLEVVCLYLKVLAEAPFLETGSCCLGEAGRQRRAI